MDGHLNGRRHSEIVRLYYGIILKGKCKGKFRPRISHEGPEVEQRYSSTLSLTSALDGVGWSTPRPGCYTPGNEKRYRLHRRLGGPQSRSGQLRKISPPPGIDPRTVQPVASRYIEPSYPGPPDNIKMYFK